MFFFLYCKNLFVVVIGFSIRKKDIDVVFDLLELIFMLMEVVLCVDGVLGMDFILFFGVFKENKKKIML